MGNDAEALLRGLFERWNHGQREFDAEVLHPQAKLRSTMTGNTYAAADLPLFFAEIDQQFSRWHVALDEVLDLAGERMLALGSVELRGRASGVELVQPVAYLVRFDGGRVRELTAFPEHEAARREAGLE